MVFIGEILFENGFEIAFVDVNEAIINALNERGSYEIEIAEEGQRHIAVSGVRGINNRLHPEAVGKAIAEVDLVTTAIGPNILPFIASLVAQGIEARQAAGNLAPLDVLACENMIGGSEFLYEEVILVKLVWPLPKSISVSQMLLWIGLFRPRVMKTRFL